MLVRRELDESSKQLGERVRTGEATYEDYYELGSILMRKRLFTQARPTLLAGLQCWKRERVGRADGLARLDFGVIVLRCAGDQEHPEGSEDLGGGRRGSGPGAQRLGIRLLQPPTVQGGHRGVQEGSGALPGVHGR